MKSEAWGWMLLGIAIGYLIGNRQSEKNKKISEEQDFHSTLKVPVTRLKNITTNTLSDYCKDKNTSTVQNGVYQMLHYNSIEQTDQVEPTEIITFNSSSNDIYLDHNDISKIHIDAPSGYSYSVNIKFSDSYGLTYEGTFEIKVV
ncbi:hypothetical protein [Armatimonas sp.]|uniref:hypothetical protein n=1 Tax=Armatimonas sp. TaxID=1872638 RepID=UPI003753C4F6